MASCARNDDLFGYLTATERRQPSTLVDRLITRARADVARLDGNDGTPPGSPIDPR